jgi:hypothetical protein
MAWLYFGPFFPKLIWSPRSFSFIDLSPEKVVSTHGGTSAPETAIRRKPSTHRTHGPHRARARTTEVRVEVVEGPAAVAAVKSRPGAGAAVALRGRASASVKLVGPGRPAEFVARILHGVVRKIVGVGEVARMLWRSVRGPPGVRRRQPVRRGKAGEPI